MESHLGRLDEELLTLLIDGEESISSLSGGLLGLEVDASTPMGEILQALDRLETKHLVEVGYWGSDSKVGESPSRPTEENLTRERSRYSTVGSAAAEPWPFVGLWYHLTPEGRAYWRNQIGGERRQARQWTIEDRPRENALIVQAASNVSAQAAVEMWKRSNPSIELTTTEPESIERGVAFELRDGTRVQDGVRWTFSRRPRDTSRVTES